MTDLPVYKSHDVSCEDPTTGTLRFIGDYSDFSVNKLFFVRLLKAEADRLNLTQARICFHKNDSSPLQVMLVYHAVEHEVRKHAHSEKDEYIQIIQGSLSVRIYDQSGENVRSLRLSDESRENSGDLFCFVAKNVVHDVVMHCDSVFLETTSGPFNKNSTVYI